MTILVTGAAGFVGLNVVEGLLAAGRDVIAYDLRPLPPAFTEQAGQAPGRMTFVQGSAERSSDLAAAFAAAKIQSVIHCAVITAGTQREVAEPETIVTANVQAAVATLAAAARAGVRRFIYPSSGAVYGNAARTAAMLDEDTLVPQPANLYAATKWVAEILLTNIARSQNIEFVAARLGNVYGPWEHATGVRDTLSPMLQAVELLERQQEAILSPAYTADYIYSRDVAAGLICLAQAATLTRALYNIGSGVINTAQIWCAELANLHPHFRWRRAAPGETPNVITHNSFDRPAMNVSHIARDINFKAGFSMPQAARDYLQTRQSTCF